MVSKFTKVLAFDVIKFHLLVLYSVHLSSPYSYLYFQICNTKSILSLVNKHFHIFNRFLSIMSCIKVGTISMNEYLC